MKKNIVVMFVFFLCCLSLNVWAQGRVSASLFKQNGSSNLYLGSAKIQEAKGDINKDGFADLVIAETEGRHIAIYWGGSDGYSLHHVYRTGDEFVAREDLEVEVSITEKGILRIETSSAVHCGMPVSEEYTNYFDDYFTQVYMLRYQNNDFYLIGGKSVFMRIGYNGGMLGNPGVSYNFLTNKAIPIDFNDTYLTDETYDIPKKPLKKLSNIKIGDYSFDDYN
ncbi:MAG: hypothetical protein K6F33_11770 [Bacteroidales bacterium]|nr:hypothetical protein [Bacteroidales bacterium]